MMQANIHIPPTEAELEDLDYGLHAVGPARNRVIHVSDTTGRELIAEIRRLRGIFDDWILHPKMTRMWDLCRHQRNELHRVKLISDDEFAALAEDDKSEDRLETYDAAREEIHCLRELCREALDHHDAMCSGCSEEHCGEIRSKLRAASEGR